MLVQELAQNLYRQYLAASIQAELGRLLSVPGRVYLAGSKEYDDANIRYTQYDRPTYIAAVIPATAEDVSVTVKYAHLRGIPCAARGGGHCVTNSMKSFQDGIAIDMSGLKSMSYDAECEHVTVEGGVQSGEFIEFIHGLKREVTVGSCPTTGLLGVCLGGGIGRLQGKYGLLSDNLVSCKIVLADGTVTQASKTENKDLFWALRGAGHSFGVVVEATFRVYPQAHGGMHHSWDFEYHVEQAADIFTYLNTLVGIMDPKLAVFVVFFGLAASGAEHIILINIVWSGAKEEALEYVSKFEAIKPIAPATQASVEWPELPWVTYQGANKTFLGNPKAWDILPYKIFSAASAKTFDVEMICEFFKDIKESNGKGGVVCSAMFEVFSHTRVKEIPDDATAFPWRNGCDIFLMAQCAAKTLEHEETSSAWLNKWKQRWVATSGYGRLQQYSNYGHGTNIPDPVEALYGYDEWRLQKLRSLKKQYDPKNWFRWYQPFQ